MKFKEYLDELLPVDECHCIKHNNYFRSDSKCTSCTKDKQDKLNEILK